MDTLATQPGGIQQELQRFGPDRCDRLSEPEARQWCARLARGHYENFSVLSPLVPGGLNDDFAAVYAFCRWADDLGDEIGDPERSLELLDWWRQELRACFDGSPRHPVFIALRPAVERHDLPIEPFDDLISAFEQDQTVQRYETWDQLHDYCGRSADPVGRLVLMLLGEPRTPAVFERSDQICTALQLTNHWQDVARDKLERDRVYIPTELNPIADFDDRLERSARQGWACDRAFLAESRDVIRGLVERTWPYFEQGGDLLPMLRPGNRPVIWLFHAGGSRILRAIEDWNYETVIHRPRLGRFTKLSLVVRAWLRARTAEVGGSRPDRPAVVATATAGEAS